MNYFNDKNHPINQFKLADIAHIEPIYVWLAVAFILALTTFI